MSLPTEPAPPVNGDASQAGRDTAPDAHALSPEELSYAFGHVPWMEFNVTARPNLKAFSAHPAVRQVISQVAQGTLNDIKDAITANVMRSINDIVDKAVKDATGDVPKHVVNNMAKAFDGLSLAPTATPVTDFQPLHPISFITNASIDSSVKDIGNGNTIDSGHNVINSGDIDSHNNNNNNNNNSVVFPPSPRPGPVPQPTPDPNPTPVLSIPKPDIATAKWIWTQETPFTEPPVGPRAFRKVVTIPSGAFVDSMVIDITCDNFYTLYVNGTVVGNGTDWTKVQRYSIKFARTKSVVIAVYATNDPVTMHEAGFIAAAVLWDSSSPNARTFTVGTDNTWTCSTTASASGFQRPNYRPDSSWGPARVEGDYGMQPWGQVAKPAATNAVAGGFSGINGIANPPAAPLAMPGPDSDGSTPL